MSLVLWNRTGNDGMIAEVVLNRPEVRNVFNTEMATQLLEAFKTLAETDVRVVVLTSSKSKAFCSGAD
ncbi:hypothetical protein BRIN106911_23055 [Brevibacillus invocatus]